MSASCRIALAALRFPSCPDESVALAGEAITQAGDAGADVVCFGECYVPGYRAPGKRIPAPDPEFLANAWSALAARGAEANIVVILGTERVIDGATRITSLVIDRDGAFAGIQDKVQLDPSEEATYAAGVERQLFRSGALTFGISICHEGWRYPETVRWAARRGAQVVFHPHFHEATAAGHRPTGFADPANSFHEKALLCRAAENTCYIASVNYASADSPTTSAIVRPDGIFKETTDEGFAADALLCHQPYGMEGLLIADLDLDAATGLLARRLKI